jgi:hypothetical protein
MSSTISVIRRTAALAAVCFVVFQSDGTALADSVRSRAVVNYTFDEESGDMLDSAAAGQGSDVGKLMNEARRVPSPFWGQTGKQALLLEADKQQFVQVADSPDLDRPEAVSLGFFFLSLHDPEFAGFHGVVAKRAADQGAVTNYGINYNPKSDAFQLYINDGGGFRSVIFSVKDIVPPGRRAFLTATFEIGRAPDSNDENRKDLRIRLFVNGKQIKPKAAPAGGSLVENDAWLTNVNVAGLLNDVPLTIGSSMPNAEFTSGLYDEFSLFAEALSPEDASKLFLEVAGPNAEKLAQQEQQPPASTAPGITALSMNGLQIGTKSRLTINGRNLGESPVVAMPIDGLEQAVQDGSNANRLIVDLTLPAETPPGYYPLRVHTPAGISDSLAVAVDHLPQVPAGQSTPDKPAELPAAFSGTLAGAAQPRIYFQGRAGDRIVADVEAKRLGAAMEPVLEIKTQRGTPLAIEWGKVHLRGDTRAEVRLPSDGLYFVELHDLAYKAPGQNPFRLKIGDLNLIDAVFPPAVLAGVQTDVEVIGAIGATGPQSYVVTSGEQVRTGDLLKLREGDFAGPAPVVAFSDAVEIVEAPPSADELQTIDATFAEIKHVPLVINGRISEPEQQDRYLLNVTPGSKLKFTLTARGLHSPLDGRLAVLKHPDGNRLAASNDAAGTRDPVLEYTVPVGVDQIQLAVGDLFERGGPEFLYRLRVAPADRPDFSLALLTPKVDLPVNGTAVLELQVNRSHYSGPIRLTVDGDDSIRTVPTSITAGSGKAFVTLSRKDGGTVPAFHRVRIVAESKGLAPPIRRIASVPLGGDKVAIPGYDDVLPVALHPPVAVSLDVADLPPALLKGLDAELPVVLSRETSPDDGLAVRLTLLSTEAVRPVDPQDANKGNKPLIRSLPYQSVAADAEAGSLTVAVPLDVAEPAIDFVVRGDLVPNAYSPQVLASVYSRPFRLPVNNAVEMKPGADEFTLTGEQQTKITGTLKRTAPFAGTVEIAVNGLPEGYTAAKIAVLADQEQFELLVTAPKIDKDTPLENITLTITTAAGAALLPNQPIKLKAVVAKPE